MRENLENTKQVKKLTKKVQILSSLLSQMCRQADEDTPSEYRTRHFRSTMDDCYEYLDEIGYLRWKK